MKGGFQIRCSWAQRVRFLVLPRSSETTHLATGRRAIDVDDDNILNPKDGLHVLYPKQRSALALARWEKQRTSAGFAIVALHETD